jgi:hypothetical protein
MLGDLRRLLMLTPAEAGYEDYRAAILEENVLGKGTASTRLWSWKKLRELYGLDPRKPVFRCLRVLWENDSAGRPLLAMLCASAREPLPRGYVRGIRRAVRLVTKEGRMDPGVGGGCSRRKGLGAKSH